MQKRPLDNFDAVRLIAAMVVVFGHAYPLTDSPSLSLLGNSVQTLAVKVFFIISGFLVTQSWLADPSPLRYLARRALRILPGLICVVLITIVILGPAVSTLSTRAYFSDPGAWRYLSNAALEPNYSLPGVFASNPYPAAVNGSLWSLPVEVAMYLAMPVFCIYLRWSKIALLAAAVLLCAASLHFVRSGLPVPRLVIYGTDWAGALDAIPYFFLGSVAQSVVARKHFDVRIGLLLALLGFAVPPFPVVQELFLYVVLPYTVISLATAPPTALSRLGAFGDMSYGIYIYGFPCEQLVAYLFNTAHEPLLNFAIASGPTLILAWLSWHLVEERFLRLKPSRKRAGQSRFARGSTPTS